MSKTEYAKPIPINLLNQLANYALENKLILTKNEIQRLTLMDQSVDLDDYILEILFTSIINKAFNVYYWGYLLYGVKLLELKRTDYLGMYREIINTFIKNDNEYIVSELYYKEIAYSNNINFNTIPKHIVNGDYAEYSDYIINVWVANPNIETYFNLNLDCSEILNILLIEYPFEEYMHTRYLFTKINYTNY